MSKNILANDAGDFLADGAGNRLVWSVDQFYDPGGIASAEAFGTLSAEHIPVFNPGGIPSGEAFGRLLALGGEEQYFGIMDDVRLFGGTLPTDGEIEDAAMRELVGTEPGLVYYDRFDTGTGTSSIPNVGGAPLTGTLSGTVRWVGFEGGSDIRGQRKPRVWGIRRQLPGVWVDHQRLVLQLNTGETESIVPFDKGLSSLTYDGDFANIYDWTTAAGHYATQLSNGLLRLHEEPLGTLSFDVKGSKTGGIYIDTPVELMVRIATDEGGIDLLSGIDLGAISDASDLRQDAVGFSTDNSPVTLAAALNAIADTIDGLWFFERGLFSLWLRTTPNPVPDYELDENDVVADGVRRTPGKQVTKAWKLGYRRYQVTSKLEDLSPSIPAADRPQYTQEWRNVRTPVDAAVARRHLDARIAESTVLYDTEAAAWAEAFRRQAIDKYSRDLYDVQLKQGVWRFSIGKTVRLKLNRFLFPSEGRLFVIGGYDEDAATGQVTLYLWG